MRPHTADASDLILSSMQMESHATSFLVEIRFSLILALYSPRSGEALSCNSQRSQKALEVIK